MIQSSGAAVSGARWEMLVATVSAALVLVKWTLHPCFH